MCDGERDRLLAVVAAGEMDPAAAEVEAERLGFKLLRPLNTTDRALEKEPFWPLSVVLAWIKWRDIETCCRFWNRLRKEAEGWVRSGPGWVVQPLRDVRHEDLRHKDGDPLIFPFDQLRLAGKENAIFATAAVSWEDRRAIGEHDWPDLELEEDLRLRSLVVGPYGSQRIYSNCLFDQRKIIERWPPDRKIGSISAQRSCERYLTDLMLRQNLKDRPAKNVVWDDCKRRFPGLSKRSFEFAWKQASEKSGGAWSRPGRRKARQQS